MPLIDATKNAENPKKQDLEYLKKNNKKCQLNNLLNKSGNVKD